jgi:hypothetical protein
MIAVSVHDYVKRLKESRIVRSKQMKYLDYIVLFTDDNKVHKIILQTYPNVSTSKARKVGLSGMLTIIRQGLPEVKINQPETKEGKYLFQYSIKDNSFQVLKDGSG